MVSVWFFWDLQNFFIYIVCFKMIYRFGFQMFPFHFLLIKQFCKFIIFICYCFHFFWLVKTYRFLSFFVSKCFQMINFFGKKWFLGKKVVCKNENLEIPFRAFLCISFFLRFFRKVFRQPKNGHGPTMSKNASSKKVPGKKVFLFFTDFMLLY